MPGARDRNLRSGDLCEGFGLELLRPFALVAPVPRQEDVGFDALATLVRRDGRRLFAEESFLVQVKAASVRSIRFEGLELDWLRELRMPLYLLSVDLKSVTLELRSMHRAAGHANYRDRKAVSVYLDDRAFELPGDEMHASLGSPILRWTPADAADESFQQTAYDVLKTWITLETENIGLRCLGMTKGIRWATNREPEPTGGYAIMHHPDELDGILEKIRPHIQTLMAMHPPWKDSSESDDGLLMGLLLVSNYMRHRGVDPDPKGLLPLFARMRVEQHGTPENSPAAGKIDPETPSAG